MGSPMSLQQERGMVYLDYTKRLVTARLAKVKARKAGNASAMARAIEEINLLEEVIRQHARDGETGSLTENDVRDVFCNDNNG